MNSLNETFNKHIGNCSSLNGEPAWILGKKYDTQLDEDLLELYSDVRSKFWFTYRKNFSPIGHDGPTTDRGWGCMLRCGQMLLGQALTCFYLCRDWKWSEVTCDPNYLSILSMFEDNESAGFSIHQIALLGATEGKAVEKQCQHADSWLPLILAVPLRVGLTKVNPVYIASLKICLSIPLSLGIIGGKPDHALYIVGFVGDEAIFLDPHFTQNVATVGRKLTPEEEEADATYHCTYFSRMSFQDMDPSIAVVS